MVSGHKSKLKKMDLNYVRAQVVELETPGTTSKLVELKKTYASSVRNQNNRVEVDLAECEEIYPSTH